MKILNFLGILSIGAAISITAAQSPVLSSLLGDQDESVSASQSEPVLLASSSNLTGTWRDDLGSRCFVSQNGSNFAWNCYDSANHGSNPPSYRWNNVFMGTKSGSTITGNWQDVPPGSNVLRGTLRLEVISSREIRIVGQTGGYGSTVLTR